MEQEQVFIAYESAARSGNGDNADAIKGAINSAKRQGKYALRVWEDLRINGRIIVESIVEEIEKSNIFACDLTYLNYNVLFELGYAIALKKKLLLLLNPSIKGAAQRFSNIDILKTIGYSVFHNSDDIMSALENIAEHPALLEDLKVVEKNNKKSHDIYYISNASNSQSDLDTIKFLGDSSNKYQVLFDSKSEVEYRRFATYIESILATTCLIVHITSTHVDSALEENAKASLLAGFALGRKRQVLIIAPKPYEAPIDYNDIMIQYSNTSECLSKLKDWLQKFFDKPIVSNHEEDTELDLLKLGLGYEVAENEKDVLENYFIETNAYSYALNKNRAFFVGRKGTGKTAIYLMLNNYLRNDPNNYVVSLKPESSQLLDNVEVARLYESSAQKTSFFYSIWKFVIYSKLVFEISQKLSGKTKYYEGDSIEGRIVGFLVQNRTMLSMHFLELIKYISEEIATETNILERIHNEYISPLKNLIIEFFADSKYCSINIIADNLDKTWDAQNDLDIQTTMLLSLFEVTGQVENDFSVASRRKVDVKIILFLRRDIFDYLLGKAREPDKLKLSTYEIDWSKYPNQLQKLLEKRFEYVLELKNQDEVNKVWSKYFDMKVSGFGSTYHRIKEACLPRPRDILMLIRNMFEAAANNNHKKVTDSDFEIALDYYSEFLHFNLVAEMNSTFPQIQAILKSLHRKFVDKIEITRFKKEISKIKEERGIGTFDEEKLINALISNGYFRIVNEKSGDVYEDYQTAYDTSLDYKYKLLGLFTLRRKCPIFVKLTPHYNRAT